VALAKSNLQQYDPEIKYKEIRDQENMYDIYDLRFYGLALKLVQGDKSTNLIKEIAYEIEVHSCLEHFHPTFPSLKINQAFRKPIEIEIEALAIE